jgi:hypothetical protein
MMPLPSSSADTIYSEEVKAEVNRQLGRLLGNSHFSHSKRFPSFMRFIVQEELEGRGDQLKERSLGIEVFGREADYDTTSDPIVRVTAAEIRKRIAQYYQESANPNELRISLPPGSYIPHFEWPKSSATISAPDGQDWSSESQGSATPSLSQHEAGVQDASLNGLAPQIRNGIHPAWLALCVALMAVFAIGGWFWTHPRPTTLDKFWAPILGSGDPVAVCFPQSHFNGITLRDAADPTQQRHMDEPMSGVVLDDLQPLTSISGMLDMRQQRYRLMGEDTATLTDLRQGPAIFIGAFDNAWTLRLTRGLRFRFGNDPQMMHFWIEDTQGPAHARWGIDRQVQETTNNYRDYAIVARFKDANTGKLAVIVAGIARGGTVAAGEFLTQAGNLDAIQSQAPKGWDSQNMEFVLSTEIIDGKSSPPRIEAIYFW